MKLLAYKIQQVCQAPKGGKEVSHQEWTTLVLMPAQLGIKEKDFTYSRQENVYSQYKVLNLGKFNKDSTCETKIS